MTEINYSTSTVNVNIDWDTATNAFIVKQGTTTIGDFILGINNAPNGIGFNFIVAAGSGVTGVPTSHPVPLNDDVNVCIKLTRGTSERNLELYAKKVIVQTTSSIALNLQLSGSTMTVLHAGADLGVVPRVWAKLNAGDALAVNLAFPTGSTLTWQVDGGSSHNSTSGAATITLPANGADTFVTLNLTGPGGSAAKKLKLNVNSTTATPKEGFAGPPEIYE